MQAENFRRMLLTLHDDIRVIIIKIADRLHNMRTLHHVPVEKRERVAQETMDIYAPLAGRMGMQDMREELEELAFQNLHPEAYSLTHSKLSELLTKTSSIINEIEASVVRVKDVVTQVTTKAGEHAELLKKVDTALRAQVQSEVSRLNALIAELAVNAQEGSHTQARGRGPSPKQRHKRAPRGLQVTGPRPSPGWP